MIPKVLAGFRLSAIDNKCNIVDACDAAGFFGEGGATGIDRQKGSLPSFEESYRLYTVQLGGPNMPYIPFVVKEVISALVKQLENAWKDKLGIVPDVIEEQFLLVEQVATYFTMGKAAVCVGKNNKTLLKAAETFIGNGRGIIRSSFRATCLT